MYFLALISYFILAIIIHSFIKRFTGKNQEPWGLPIIGHMFFLGKNPARTFLEWKNKYGPVYQIYLAHKRVLVLNDRQSITECFAKPETSGRSSFALIDWCLRRAGTGLLFNEGHHAEEQRQFFLQSFRKYGIAKNKMEEILSSEVSELLLHWRSLSGKYFNLSGSCTQYVLNSVWRIVGSKRYDYKEAASILEDIGIMSDADSWFAKLTYIAPWLINMFSGEVDHRMQAYGRLSATQSELATEHQKTIVSNEPRDIFDMFLDKVEDTTDPSSIFHPSQNAIGPAFRDVLIGTIETTSLTLEWFILYITKHPEVYHKLRNEIDGIIDSNRHPTLADKENMPYIQACILETLRKSSIVPLSLPHSALTDTQFRGFHIPKGTLIFGNLYAVHHDLDTWEAPERFYPERFLTPNGTLIKDAKNKILPFGTGKRACIGSSIVEDELFLLLASLYKEFTIEFETKPKSLEGVYGMTYRPLDSLRVAAVPRQSSS